MKETMEKQPSLESWDDFTGRWLKAEHFKKFPDETFVANVTSQLDKDGQGIVILDLQYSGRKWKKQLNKTDIKKLRDLGVSKPIDLKDHAIIWEKVRVRDPSKNILVDSIAVQGFRK